MENINLLYPYFPWIFYFSKSRFTTSFQDVKVTILSLDHLIVFNTMSTFKVPKRICTKADAIIKKIWWNFDPNKSQNSAFKSWKSIC